VAAAAADDGAVAAAGATFDDGALSFVGFESTFGYPKKLVSPIVIENGSLHSDRLGIRTCARMTDDIWYGSCCVEARTPEPMVGTVVELEPPAPAPPAPPTTPLPPALPTLPELPPLLARLCSDAALIGASRAKRLASDGTEAELVCEAGVLARCGCSLESVSCVSCRRTTGGYRNINWSPPSEVLTASIRPSIFDWACRVMLCCVGLDWSTPISELET